MGKLVVITGSPRKQGNSNRMAEAFRIEAESLGHQVAVIDAAEKNLTGCVACNSCYQKGKACAVASGFQDVAEAIETADGVVLAFPIYWYSIPAQIKSIIDHFYAFFVGKVDLSGKKAGLLCCCAEPDTDVFTGAQFAVQRTMALLQMDIVGTVLQPGVSGPGDVEQTQGIQQAKDLAHKF